MPSILPAPPLPVQIDRIWKQAHREEIVRQRFDTGTWRVSELVAAIADEPVFELPLAHLDLGGHNLDGDPGGLIAFARHMKHVLEADLSVPIILDEWGGILDGRHRVVKALVEGHSFVLAKRVPAGTRPTERP